MKLLVVILGMLCSHLFVSAQRTDSERIWRQRMNHIHRVHAGVGVEYAANCNTAYGVRGYIGLGSHRHLIDADLGLGLRFWNLFTGSRKSYFSMVQMPLFASSTVHPIRWSDGCLYAGGEALVLFGIRNLSKNVLANENAYDPKPLRNYGSVRGKIGVVHHKINISLFYEHDLAPLCDQKIIYESGRYDFNAIRESIYERNRIGLSISYLFNL